MFGLQVTPKIYYNNIRFIFNDPVIYEVLGGGGARHFLDNFRKRVDIALKACLQPDETDD